MSTRPEPTPSISGPGARRDAIRADVVIATGNAKKLRELADLLAPSGLIAVAQRELGVSDADETGLTFVENAILKARHAAAATGLPAIADDSGLEVDALGGAPGVFSARFAGTHGDDAANNRRLLECLQGVPKAQRRARYRCVMVALRHARDPSPLIREGTWEGSIALTPGGREGFGYDPLFLVEEYGVTAAELPFSVKQRLSHRGRAVRALVQALPAFLAGAPARA